MTDPKRSTNPLCFTRRNLLRIATAFCLSGGAWPAAAARTFKLLFVAGYGGPPPNQSIRSGVVDLHFLEPIATAGYDYDHRTELMTAAWSAMADLLQSEYGVSTNESPVAKRA